MIIKLLSDWVEESHYGAQADLGRRLGITRQHVGVSAKRGHYLIDNEVGRVLLVRPDDVEFFQDLKTQIKKRR